MFVTTANTLDTIPGPLRDRMEVIQLAGYTEEEKLEIAKRYLVPRQIERNGLTPSRIAFTDAGLRTIIADYTREAGVRQLEREIGTVCRKVARQVAEGTLKRKVTITEPRVRETARQAPVLLRGPAPDRPSRGGDRPRVDPGRRRGAVHRGDRDARQGQADDHRPARRGDAGVRAGGLSYVRSNASDVLAGAAGGLVRHPRHPHPRARRRDAEGRPERRRGDGHRARLAALRAAGPGRRRDDRRDHADRAGAADRRAQGEGARRPAQQDPLRDRARRSTSRTSTRSPSTCARTSSSSSSRRSTRCSTSRSSAVRARASRRPADRRAPTLAPHAHRVQSSGSVSCMQVRVHDPATAQHCVC